MLEKRSKISVTRNLSSVAIKISIILFSIILMNVKLMGNEALADIIQPEIGDLDLFIEPGVPGVPGVQVGQSFTADGSVSRLDSIGFFYSHSDYDSPARTMTLDLFEGQGFGGPLIGSRTTTGGFGNYWKDFLLDGIVLSPGQVYSFRISSHYSAGGLPVDAYYFDPDNPYAAGSLIHANGTADPSADLTFRVLGSPATDVPAPATISLLAVGLIGLGFVGRRRRAGTSGSACGAESRHVTARA